MTLLDAWGPGNPRSSSGGETRVMRGTYGPDQPYTKLAARAMELWKEHEKRWKCRLFHRTGVLWMATTGDDQFERGSLSCCVRPRYGSKNCHQRRWRSDGRRSISKMCVGGFMSRKADFCIAKQACQAVVNGFVAEGGEYKQAEVAVAKEEPEYREGLRLSDGSKLADRCYVFACGPWLGKLFPQTDRRSRSGRRSRTCFSSELRRKMTVSQKPGCRCGPIIATASCMEFLRAMAVASRLATTRGGRNLIRLQGNGR